MNITARSIFRFNPHCRFSTSATPKKAVDFRLWHSPGARSLRCLWTAEELSLSGYDLITMPFPPRVTHKEFLKHNVLGTIPYFEDGDVRMTESSAICQYMATKYGPSSLVVLPDEDEYGQYLNWLYHADATLTFPQTIVLRYTLQQRDRADNAAIDYAKWYLARLRLLDSVLSCKPEGQGSFLVGNRFTVADICIAYALYLGQSLQLDGKPLSSYYQPQTKKYMDQMTTREAFVTSLDIQKKSLAEFKKEHPSTATAPPSPVK